nr:phosphodiester glycosidase family protein [Aurantiacibacter rhizosphaerae]
MIATAACSIRTDAEDQEQRVSICEPIVFEDSPFTHCTAQPGKHDIAMALSPEDSDRPYRSLGALSDALGDQSAGLALAMNGGMYDADGNPIGYYVEDGKRLGMLNQNDGPGNFHLLPNGVFFGETASGPWRVWDTQRFADDIEERPQFATQSGPMLVIDGELHPAFDTDGSSRKIRNAVGVDAAGRAHFIITEAPVSFGKLARLYRDVLKVNNALFLDGSVSQIWDPAKGRLDTGPSIGPIILVTDTESAE